MPQYISTDPAAGEPVVAPDSGKPLGGWLPTAGGLVGSTVGTLLGPVGRVAGAGLGGALGKGAEMFFDEKDDSLGDTMRGMGKAAVAEGGGEIAGGVIGKGVTKVGKLLYKGGVGLLPKGLKQGFAHGDQSGTSRLAEAGFNEGIALTERGAKKASTALETGSQQVRDKLSMMQRAGARPVSIESAVDATKRTADKVGKEPIRAQRLGEIEEFQNALRRENPDPIPLVDTWDMTKAAQRVATEGYKKVAQGAPINTLALDLNMDAARGLRGAIEDRADVGAMTHRLQGLVGLEQGADHASQTGHVLSRLGGAGVMGGLGFAGGGPLGAIGAAGAGAMFTTPQGLTTAGLGLKAASPAAQAASARLAALIAALAAEQ
jgi:hypothetical protein